jgi:hypothetical protein
MTFTTHTKREATLEDIDEVKTVIEALPVILTVSGTERLRTWMQEIENRARKLFRSVPSKRLGSRDPMAVAAAAVHEACLQFRATTGVKVPFHRLELAAGVSVHKIRGAYSRFFNNSVGLRKDRLNMMTVDDSMELPDLIHEAVKHLRKGVERTTPSITGWFTRVEGMALQLVRDMNLPEGIHPEVAALSAIYEASHRLHGPRLVNITYKDTMEVCGMSGALVSKTRMTLFPKNGG